MAMSRADKLKRLKMPGRPMAEEDMEMDLAMEDLEGLEDDELPEEEAEMPEAAEELDMAAMLEDLDDEALLEEARRRGLLPDEAGEDEMLDEEDEELAAEDEELALDQL